MNRPLQPHTRPLSTIALVTPSFNTAPYLAETLESVLLQGYPALEYVVVDGGSTDGSVQILERYRERLHALVAEPDDGHADAINKGFALTSGSIMGWINSDDLLHRDALATVDAVFAAFPQVDWITGIPTTALGGGERTRERSSGSRLHDGSPMATSSPVTSDGFSRSRRSGDGRCGTGRVAGSTRASGWPSTSTSGCGSSATHGSTQWMR